jgi:EAL domain-containing protein (putative c-di-GMP-specific phosphodiesterase class I)
LFFLFLLLISNIPFCIGIAIAKQLDLKVTAEGIEGNEEYQFLAKINCDFGQGYGISKPLPAGDFEKRFLFM